MNHDLDIDMQDIDWVAGQQTQRIQSDPFVTSDPFARERAMQALIHHMDSNPGRRFGLRRLLGARTLGLAAAGGAAAVIAVVLLSSGGSDNHSAGDPSTGTAAVTPTGGHASPQPLMQLADYVSESPAPTGNATVVQRTTSSGGKSETVFDLYGDDGRYVFSPTEAGLAEVIAGDPAAVEAGDADDGGTSARQLAAANEADSGNVQAGAEDMASAFGTKQRYSPADGSHYDNMAWINAQEAIIAGAGRPEIRAGVLKILATLPGVKVTEGVEDGVATLILTSGPAESGPGYTEQLTIDARTGVPIKFVGGPTGGPPETEVEYQVSRADYAGLGSTAAE